MHSTEYDDVRIDLFPSTDDLKANGLEGYRSRGTNLNGEYFVLLRDDAGTLEVMPSDKLLAGEQWLEIRSVSPHFDYGEWPHHDIEAAEIPVADISEEELNKLLDAAGTPKTFFAIEMRLWAGQEELPKIRVSMHLSSDSARTYFNSLRRNGLAEAKLRNSRATRAEVLLRHGKTLLANFTV
jgi:hypothetical protein